MKRVLEFLKNHKYFVGLFVLIGFSIVLSTSYSNYFVTSSNHRVAEMYIGSLKYSMKIDSNETNTLTVEPGVTIIDVDVNNLNPVDTYYKLLYLNNSNLEIKYFSETKDTDEVKTSYKSPNDSITSGNTNNLKLFIRNNSDTNQEVSFSLKGGYINNTLSDIRVPSGYSEITTIETPSSNTYFCKTDDTLTQGLEYVNGQYTYGYKKEGKYVSSGIDWQNITTNGWGVQLTDKTSTDVVTSKLCTYINNKPVESMRYMFYKSQALTLDLSKFDTNKVTNMSYMFASSQVTTLDLSNLNTSNVTNMSDMFYYSEAVALDLSNFNTSNVTDMSYMFYHSQSTTLNVGLFDTNNVTNMSSMFSGSIATEINGLENFDTSNVTDMSFMFNGVNVIKLNLNNFNTSNVTNMSGMFIGSEVTELDLSNFDTSKVTNMSSMFSNIKINSLNLSNFDTSNVTNMESMFNGSKVVKLDLNNFNTSKVKNMSYMFRSGQATSLDLSGFDTSNVTNMYGMFDSSTELKTIYVSDKFNTDKVTSSTKMFNNCTKLVGGSGTKYNSSYTNKTYARIDGGTSSPGYFTDVSQKPSTFDTDDWTTIVKSVKEGNTRKYKVGDTKTIDMGSYGTHTLRVANTSTPSECSTSGFSQTACGFVLEFADIIVRNKMNNTNTNKNGWPSTNMRTFVNNDIYNSLPSDLKNGIINTTVVSGYGSSDSSNFTSTDKLYLLSTAEIWEQGTSNTISNDSSRNVARQLDYYKNLGVSTTNYSGLVIKKYESEGTYIVWWLRPALTTDSSGFHAVGYYGNIYSGNASSELGVSPAFRIG